MSGLREHLRVLMILEEWGRGGTEQYVRQLSNELKGTGKIELHLATLKPGDEKLMEEQQDWAQTRSVVTIDRLATHCCELQADIVHLHLYTSLLAVTNRLRASGGSPLMATLHMPLTAWGLRHRWKWRRAIRRLNQVVCNSKATRDSLGRLRDDLHVIPAGVEIPEVIASPIRQSGDPLRIVCVGRLSPEKDWGTLLRAIASVKNAGDHQVDCEIIGDGRLQAELERVIERLGLIAHVRLAGFLTHDEAMRRLQQGDLSVLPSKFEGLGMSAMESMAMSVPTITSDFPASAQLVEHGRTGHRFPIGDAEKLAELIGWHCDHSVESRKMGEAGRAVIAEQFSATVTTRPYLELYKQLVSGAQPGPKQVYKMAKA